MINKIKNILFYIKRILFSYRNGNKLLLKTSERPTNITDDFRKSLTNEKIKIWDIKRKVDNGQTKVQELSIEQQKLLLEAYQQQKIDLENTIENLRYQLNKS